MKYFVQISTSIEMQKTSSREQNTHSKVSYSTTLNSALIFATKSIPYFTVFNIKHTEEWETNGVDQEQSAAAVAKHTKPILQYYLFANCVKFQYGATLKS